MHLYEQSLSCLASWVQFGVPLPQLESLTVETLQALHNPQLFDTAIETVVHIILQHENYRFIFQRIINHFTSSHIDDVIVAMTYAICYFVRYPTSVTRLLPHVLNLKSLWNEAVENEQAVTVKHPLKKDDAFH